VVLAVFCAPPTSADFRRRLHILKVRDVSELTVNGTEVVPNITAVAVVKLTPVRVTKVPTGPVAGGGPEGGPDVAAIRQI